jgi:hypothetical protein
MTCLRRREAFDRRVPESRPVTDRMEAWTALHARHTTWAEVGARLGWREHSERPISPADLKAIGRDAVDITFRVINAVTSNRIQFPGSESPG